MNRKSIVATIMLALVVTGLVPLSQSMNVQAQTYHGLDGHTSAADHREGNTILKIKCDNRIINVNGDVNGADTPQIQNPQTQNPQTLDFMGLLEHNEQTETDSANTPTGNGFGDGNNMGLLEPNEQTETDSANTPTGNGFGDGSSIAKDLLCLNQNNNNNGQNGEEPPTPPPVVISGCEGCFIDAVVNSANPEANAAKLLLKLNSDSGIAITIGNVFIVHSLFELCRVIDRALVGSQVDAAVQSVIDQAQLDLTAQEIATLKQCVRDAVGV